MAGQTFSLEKTSKVLWAGALGVAFLLSILAAFRGGYIGPDYNTHLARLIAWPKVFDFSTTSPPAYYLFGHALFLIIGSDNAFPITLSIIQAAINILAMWCFFLYTEPRFKSPAIHLALVFFLTFLPVRIIHATTIGTDCTTIPLFVPLLFLFDKFLSDQSAKNAASFGLGLTLAVFTKYSFMAILPAAFAILVCCWWKRAWKLKRFVMICTVSLVLPSTLSLYSFWASSRTHGYNTEKHWLHKGMAAEMNYKDIFSLKANDLQLFRAPEYFKREILAAHKHGYLALSHMGVFTDPMNLFQVLPIPQRLDVYLIPDQKTRPPWKTPIMVASMSLGTLWTLLALIGVPWSLIGAVRNLVRNKLQREDVMAVLGTAFFLLMFLPIPFVYAGVIFGYWTPRLILPSLLYFFLAAFLLIDRKIAVQSPNIVVVTLALVMVQSAIEIVMLA